MSGGIAIWLFTGSLFFLAALCLYHLAIIMIGGPVVNSEDNLDAPPAPELESGFDMTLGYDPYEAEMDEGRRRLARRVKGEGSRVQDSVPEPFDDGRVA